jgi:hypothetical protein
MFRWQSFGMEGTPSSPFPPWVGRYTPGATMVSCGWLSGIPRSH